MKKWLLLAFLLGCRGAVDSDFEPALATLTGTLNSQLPVATTAPIRVALVWVSGTLFLASTTDVEQDVEVSASFPTNFTVKISEVPPAAAMVPADLSPANSGQSATGILVVYEDTNNNGKLDLIPYDSPEQVDIVLGDSISDLSNIINVNYSSIAQATTPKGFSLTTLNFSGGPPYREKSEPISTPMTITLTGDPALRVDACDLDPNSNDSNIAPLGDPSLLGATFTCNADGSATGCVTADTGCNYPHCETQTGGPYGAFNWPTCPLPQ